MGLRVSSRTPQLIPQGRQFIFLEDINIKITEAGKFENISIKMYSLPNIIYKILSSSFLKLSSVV